MSLYTDLKSAEQETDSHESDLYVRCTPEALALVRASRSKFSLFHHAVSKATWIEIPFAYDPWWEARER